MLIRPFVIYASLHSFAYRAGFLSNPRDKDLDRCLQGFTNAKNIAKRNPRSLFYALDLGHMKVMFLNHIPQSQTTQ